MADENKIETTEIAADGKTRRTFIKTAAQVAVTAPAVAVLLNATTTPAAAALNLYQVVASHILDDYTYGNNKDDFVGPADGAH